MTDLLSRLERMMTERPVLVGERATLAELTALGEMVFPSVVEYRGCLIDADALGSPHLDDWFSGRYSADQIEYVLNHIHLWDVVDTEDAQLMSRLPQLTLVVADIWRWWLPQQTSIPIEVWTADDPEEYGPTVGFRSLARRPPEAAFAQQSHVNSADREN